MRYLGSGCGVDTIMFHICSCHPFYSDFLTRSYDIGGVVSVMALSSLYAFMTQHGLEYPNFYDKLYALLEPSVSMAKYPARFFQDLSSSGKTIGSAKECEGLYYFEGCHLQLLDSWLKSSLLPAYLAAAFCKKLSRLALFVPPVRSTSYRCFSSQPSTSTETSINELFGTILAFSFI